DALRKEVLTEFLDLHGKDYYQVLRLGRDAQPEDIAEAYAALGKRFRLERFAGVDLGRDYARLEELHQVFRQAFEALSARDHREAYDRTLEKRPARVRATLDGELLTHKGSERLTHGDYAGGRKAFEEAVAIDP